MSREHKYRAWNKKFNIWAYGYYVQIGDTHWIAEQDVEFRTAELDEARYVERPETGIYGMCEVDPETVGEFTGLKDCKRTEEYPDGQEIYEGDIVVVLDRDWPSQMDSCPELNHQQYKKSISSVCVVVWNNGSFYLDKKAGRGYYYPQIYRSRGRDVFEVIGNIHENPELLEAR